MFHSLLQFTLNRFKESSSWIGIFMVLSSFGLELNDIQQNAIIFFGMAFLGTPQVSLDQFRGMGKK